MALAFTIGRTQESLYRLDAGEALALDERSRFGRIADLFADASEGLTWVEAVVRGQPEPVSTHTSRYLHAFKLVMPYLQKQPQPVDVAKVLDAVADVAVRLSRGETVAREPRKLLAAVLETVARYAADEARVELDAAPQIRPFAALA
jgi:hypothetical protein